MARRSRNMFLVFLSLIVIIEHVTTRKKNAFMMVFTHHLPCGMTIEQPSLILMSRKNDDNFYMSCNA